MGAAERIAELMKTMQEREVAEVLDFAEFLVARRAREKGEAWEVMDKYAGRYDDSEWQREDLYDRACLR